MLGSDLVLEARRRAGLTQRQLADVAGTTQSAIARMEAGRSSPAFDQVVRLLRLCGFRLDVSLDPYDGSDLAQAEELDGMDAQARLDYLVDVVGALESLRSEIGLAG